MEAKAAKRPAGLGCVLVLVKRRAASPGQSARTSTPSYFTYLPTFLPGPVPDMFLSAQSCLVFVGPTKKTSLHSSCPTNSTVLIHSK